MTRPGIIISPPEGSPRVSWLVLCALVLGSLTALVSTALYIKTLQEKRAEQVMMMMSQMSGTP